MPRKNPQDVSATMTCNNGRGENQEVGICASDKLDTNSGNLTSKIQQWVRKMLIQYNVEDGAVLTIVIDPEKKDEFANPER